MNLPRTPRFNGAKIPALALLLAFHATGAAAQASETTLLSTTPNAMTALYYSGSFDHDFAVSAKLTLSEQQANAGYDCVWLMLVDHSRPSNITKPPFHEPPFVQAGLMRGWHSPKLTAFVTSTRGGANTGQYTDLQPLSDGPHIVSLTGIGADIVLSIDGRKLYVFERSRYFPQHAKLQLSIGSELSHPGDRAAARVSDVRIGGPGATAENARPDWVYAREGLHFSVKGTAFASSGRFDPALPSAFEKP